MRICIRCNKNPVEDFGDGEPSYNCGYCNDRLIEQSDRQREWDYYHPGEPAPKCEIEG